MAGRAKNINATPKLPAYGLDVLRDRPGWEPCDGGWTNSALDVTVTQAAPQRYRFTRHGQTRDLTSCNGVLLVIDLLERAAQTPPAQVSQ